MTKITYHPGDALIAEYQALEEAIRRTAFPALEVETVTDDGETYQALRCPRCGGQVNDANLAAVDQSTRWNYADWPDDDSFDHERLTFNQGDSDFDSTLYYLHNDDHAVSLPDGWTEEWT